LNSGVISVEHELLAVIRLSCEILGVRFLRLDIVSGSTLGVLAREPGGAFGPGWLLGWIVNSRSLAQGLSGGLGRRDTGSVLVIGSCTLSGSNGGRLLGSGIALSGIRGHLRRGSVMVVGSGILIGSNGRITGRGHVRRGRGRVASSVIGRGRGGVASSVVGIVGSALRRGSGLVAGSGAASRDWDYNGNQSIRQGIDVALGFFVYDKGTCQCTCCGNLGRFRSPYLARVNTLCVGQWWMQLSS
jgi:hypothetical protein